MMFKENVAFTLHEFMNASPEFERRVNSADITLHCADIVLLYTIIIIFMHAFSCREAYHLVLPKSFCWSEAESLRP